MEAHMAVHPERRGDDALGHQDAQRPDRDGRIGGQFVVIHILRGRHMRELSRWGIHTDGLFWFMTFNLCLGGWPDRRGFPPPGAGQAQRPPIVLL